MANEETCEVGQIAPLTVGLHSDVKLQNFGKHETLGQQFDRMARSVRVQYTTTKPNRLVSYQYWLPVLEEDIKTTWLAYIDTNVPDIIFYS
jgi:hypothetical protein